MDRREGWAAINCGSDYASRCGRSCYAADSDTRTDSMPQGVKSLEIEIPMRFRRMN
jgi:hypothetical protein